ncbi:hypothetical protein GCM10009839_44260 [Catenulispora yoronensis]|uniref:ROK family protein n=1 Tax=Catenulispora yoronensis TaxID=450799 RepID=A0ABP5G518_9ACTN
MNQHNYGPSAAASVVLDLGGTIGALIIEAGPEHLGTEIEISPFIPDPDDRHVHRTHSMVRERLTSPRTYDAVYADLRAGVYTIWRDAHTPAATVTVVGGQISRYTWAD